MHRNDDSRPSGNSRFNQSFIDIHRIGTNVHENDLRSPDRERICRARKRKTRHDHFVARVNIHEQCSHFESLRTRGRQQSFMTAKFLLKPFMTTPGVFPIPGDLRASHRGKDMSIFITGIRRAIELNGELHRWLSNLDRTGTLLETARPSSPRMAMIFSNPRPQTTTGQSFRRKMIFPIAAARFSTTTSSTGSTSVI